jgi:hypothetical protein
MTAALNAAHTTHDASPAVISSPVCAYYVLDICVPRVP